MAVANPSNIQLAEQQVRLESIWAEPQRQKSYVPRVDSLKAVLEQQTAILAPIEDSQIEADFKVKWVDHAAITPVSLTQNDDCANTAGSEGLGKTATFALDYRKAATFSVELDQREKSFIDIDEMIATGQASAIKSLLEDFNATIPAAIETNRGTPVAAYVTGGVGPWVLDTPNKELEIPTASWTVANIIPQLMRVKRLARFADAIIMDGGSLFNEYYSALRTEVNADGKTAATMLGDIPYRHDLDGYSAASLTSSFHMIDPGTIAIANRAKYPSLANAKMTNGAAGNYLRYSIPVNIAGLPQMAFVNQGSLIKQSLMMDVQYSIICTGGKELATWKIILRAGIFFNPARLLATNSGILKFTKV
jgi:hypothetical protein